MSGPLLYFLQVKHQEVFVAGAGGTHRGDFLDFEYAGSAAGCAPTSSGLRENPAGSPLETGETWFSGRGKCRKHPTFDWSRLPQCHAPNPVRIGKTTATRAFTIANSPGTSRGRIGDYQVR